MPVGNILSVTIDCSIPSSSNLRNDGKGGVSGVAPVYFKVKYPPHAWGSAIRATYDCRENALCNDFSLAYIQLGISRKLCSPILTTSLEQV